MSETNYHLRLIDERVAALKKMEPMARVTWAKENYMELLNDTMVLHGALKLAVERK